MQIAYKTDTGKRRSHNEDCCFAGNGFAVLADGMGGHNKGEVASRMAVDILTESLSSSAKKHTKADLKKAIVTANKQIYAKSKTDETFAGMGTTVVACVWDEQKITIAYVGDSRCYEIAEHDIQLITKDHTLVQTLLDEGKITENEAADYPDKHIITRAVGTDANENPDMIEIERKEGQWLILCSDGLTNHVNADSILACTEKNAEPQVVADQLVDMANAGGGLDNITVIVIQF